jgi:hypothetical protein
MNIFHRIFFSTSVVALVLLASCGDPTQGTPIAVTFSPDFQPPSSIDTGAYAGIAATVSNDPHNGGVLFSCAPMGACGTFTPQAAGSAIPVCYLAPVQVPAGGSVTITASATSDPTKFVSATVSVMNGAPNPCP